MTITAEHQKSKQEYVDFLRAKTELWKADTEAYVHNSESLIRDSVIDIVTGKYTHSEVTTKRHRLQDIFLDKFGQLPKPFVLRLNAIVAYAAEMGIDLSYTLTEFGEETLVEWKVNSVDNPATVQNYVSPKMKSTRADVMKEVEATTKKTYQWKDNLL